LPREHSYEYINDILELLTKRGPSSKYRIAKGSRIPYPTILRKLPELEKAGMIKRIGEGKRGAEIYVATPTGALLSYFNQRVNASELFLATPTIMKYVETRNEELPAIKDPLGFMVGELPFKLSRLERLKVEEAISALGAILVLKHDEWYHRIDKEELKHLLASEENYQILKRLVSNSMVALEKIGDQANHLRSLSEKFLVELERIRKSG